MELKVALIEDAARRAAAYHSSAKGRGVFPSPEAIGDLDQISWELPDHPIPAADVLEQLDTIGSPATVLSTHGRYFGFVTGGTDPAGAAASILAGAWDQNIGLPIMSPIAARLDEIAAGWVCDLLGLPVSSAATFCAGASLANLTCVLAARDALLHRAGWSVETQGHWI